MSVHPITIHPIPGFSEPVSSISHLLGALVVLVFAAPLLRRGWGHDRHALALGVFVLSALLTLTISGIYHLLPHHTVAKAVFDRLDHAGIFILIAGSFTPPHVILFRGWWRWGVLTFVWALAAAGITLSLVALDEIPDWFTFSYYLGLGWIGAFSGTKAWRLYGFRFITPILIGGLAYTAGGLVDFFRWPILLPGVIEGNELFHLAVLAGLACHWYFMRKIAQGWPPPNENSGIQEFKYSRIQE